MKKSVYVTGISCAILMLVGCVTKLMHWPGANPLILASVLLFCFWFLPAGLMNSYNLMPLKKMKTLHVVSFFVFFICMMGVLFKVMHWPGAGLLLFPGLMLPFVVFLPVYLYHTREEEKTGNKNFFGITIGLTFLAVFGVLLALSVSKQVIWQAVEAVNHNESDTKFYSVVTTGDNEISKSASDLYNYTDELKCMLLTTADENMCSGNKPNANYNPANISNLDDREVVKRILIRDEARNRAKVLKEKINAFREVILASKNVSPELADLVKSLFNTSDEDLNGIYPQGVDWIDRELNGYSLVFTLDFLSKLQSNVRLVEGEALK